MRIGAGVLLSAWAVLLAGPIHAGVSDDPASLGSSGWSLPGQLQLYRPNYVLPVTWTERAEGVNDVELKFQLSLMHQIGRTPFFVAYTQVSYLRWLAEEASRPIRETNYQPEIWYRFRPGRLTPDWLGLDLGYVHESNGGGAGESRSWNRLYVRPWFDQGRWSGYLELWVRIPEENKPGPEGDNNPHIVEYYGHHRLRLEYRFTGGDWIAITTRYAFSESRGSLLLEYAIPTATGDSYYFFQLFTGYGESLETFKEYRSRIGVGFALLPLR